MKKFVALLLSFCMILPVIPAASEENDLDVVIAYDTVMSLIGRDGYTDKTEGQLLKSAVLKLMREDKELYYKVLDNIAKSVDENSAFYSPEEWKAMMTEFAGKTGGIGVVVSVISGYLEIVSVIEKGPADRVNLESGDRIIECDGRDITGKNAETAVNYLRGETGSVVSIKVLKRDGSIRDYSLTRDEIALESVASAILEEDKIGYLNIASFTQETANEARNKFNEFQNSGIKNVIIDLRNNGGGILESAREIASMLLDKGETIVEVKCKIEALNEVRKAQGREFDFDIVVLINGYSASASEVLAAALTDNGEAISIGEKSYGKATVQQLYPMGGFGGLKITVQQYFTPKGEFIHGQGITPTYEVINEKKTYEAKDITHPSYTRKFKEGDEDEEIKIIEELLYKLNYDVGTPDNKFEANTRRAVTQFQESEGLYPYGVCDITTQSHITNKILTTEFIIDTQLEQAINYFKNGGVK